MAAQNLKIEKLTPQYVDGAVELCVREGWNVDQKMVRGFQANLPEGSVVALDGDLLVGYCSGDVMNEEHGFICYFVIKEQYRGKGIGSKLFTKTLEALGQRNVCLYSSESAAPIYKKRWGFKSGDPPVILVVTRFVPQREDKEDPAPDVNIRTMTPEDLDLVTEYDKTVHIIERKQFIKQYMEEKDYGIIATDATGYICGYAFVQKRPMATKAMPLYADKPSIAKKLLNYVFDRMQKDEKLQIIFHQSNEAEELFKNYGLPQEDRFIVEFMWTKSRVEPRLEKVYSLMNMSNVFT